MVLQSLIYPFETVPGRSITIRKHSARMTTSITTLDAECCYVSVVAMLSAAVPPKVKENRNQYFYLSSLSAVATVNVNFSDVSLAVNSSKCSLLWVLLSNKTIRDFWDSSIFKTFAKTKAVSNTSFSSYGPNKLECLYLASSSRHFCNTF